MNPYQGLAPTPGNVNMNIPGPPVATPSNANPLVVPPVSGPAAQETVDATIAAGEAQRQANAQSFFADLNTSIVNAQNAAAGCPSTIAPSLGVCDSTIYWTAGILAGVVALSAFMKGGR